MSVYFIGVMMIGICSLSEVSKAYYGEPIVLKSNYIYFTSWKYVRQGNFAWDVQFDPNTPESEKKQPSYLRGDGIGARFRTIDMPYGIRLVAQPAQKIPLETGQFIAQLFDEGKYKAWYTVDPCSDPEPFSSKDKILPGHNAHIAYAESKDGITWEKPNLGIYEYDGNKNNNIVFRGDVNGSIRGFHGGCVFVDPTSVDEHYKMLYLGIITDEEWKAFEKKYPDEVDTMARRPDIDGYRCVFGVFGAFSADGIHWKSIPEPLMIQHADTMNTCYYDLDRRQYVAYIRMWQVNERAEGFGSPDSTSWITVGRRSIGRSVSNDFRHFSKPELVFATGAEMSPSHVWYTNGKTTLPGCPDNHIMFPWLWELERDGGDVWLLSSADGWTWSRVPSGPVITCGNSGESDGEYVVCTGNLLEYPDKTWRIGYTGHPIPHKYPGRDVSKRKGLFPGVQNVSGLATWQKGRLVALQCDGEGEFATVAVIPPTDKIRLNAIVRPTGYIKVAVRLLEKGIPLRNFDDTDRIVGDGLEMPVKWNGDPTIPHQGKPIILSFKLKQVKLFGIEFY